MNTAIEQITDSLKADSIGFAASQDQENQKLSQQEISITGRDKISENEHHVHGISHHAADSFHRRYLINITAFIMYFHLIKVL